MPLFARKARTSGPAVPPPATSLLLGAVMAVGCQHYRTDDFGSHRAIVEPPPERPMLSYDPLGKSKLKILDELTRRQMALLGSVEILDAINGRIPKSTIVGGLVRSELFHELQNTIKAAGRSLEETRVHALWASNSAELVKIEETLESRDDELTLFGVFRQFSDAQTPWELWVVARDMLVSNPERCRAVAHEWCPDATAKWFSVIKDAAVLSSLASKKE